MVAGALLLAGCSINRAAPRPSLTETCAGNQAATTEVLNLNATPPRLINGVRVAVSAIEADDKGPWADLSVIDEAGKTVVLSHVVVDQTFPSGTGQLRVTHICKAENLPDPMPPGTSRGTVGLAAVK